MSILDGYIVNQEIKTILKIYPEFARLHTFEEPLYIRRFDYAEKRPFNPDKIVKNKTDPEDYERTALYRAKTKVIDLALSNNFDLFTTFTFATNRQDVDAKKRQMQYWLNNQRILHGKFGYIMVPEYHKDGKSLHFHGLFSGYAGTLIDSGKKKNDRIIYNISSYRGGFSTAVKIDNIAKVAGYVGKYLTKDMPLFKNKQRYFRSNGLILPIKVINPILTTEDKELFVQIYKGKKDEILELRGSLNEEFVKRITNNGIRRVDDLLVAEL